jgi:hypothetical protein
MQRARSTGPLIHEMAASDIVASVEPLPRGKQLCLDVFAVAKQTRYRAVEAGGGRPDSQSARNVLAGNESGRFATGLPHAVRDGIAVALRQVRRVLDNPVGTHE